MREFTHPSVFAGIAAGADWADPTMTPEEIDWTERQARAAIPFKVVGGRPVIPGASTGITRGRNELGHWGEMQCADALVMAIYRSMSGRRASRWIVLIERGDDHGWAVPGGKADPGETALQAALRELEEETGLLLPGQRWETDPAELVDDPRASDESWMVTTLARTVLDATFPEHLPEPVGADDARRALWVPADSYDQLCQYLAHEFGADVFRAHQAMLKRVLG